VTIIHGRPSAIPLRCKSRKRPALVSGVYSEGFRTTVFACLPVQVQFSTPASAEETSWNNLPPRHKPEYQGNSCASKKKKKKKKLRPAAVIGKMPCDQWNINVPALANRLHVSRVPATASRRECFGKCRASIQKPRASMRASASAQPGNRPFAPPFTAAINVRRAFPAHFRQHA